MRWWYQELSAINDPFTRDPGFPTPPATVDILPPPGTDIIAFTMLTQVQVYKTDENSAQSYISKYVAKGDPHNGNWQVLAANDVTSMTFNLDVTNGFTQALLLMFAYNDK